MIRDKIKTVIIKRNAKYFLNSVCILTHLTQISAVLPIYNSEIQIVNKELNGERSLHRPRS